MGRTASPLDEPSIDWDAYYSQIQIAYDRMASEYDETIGRSSVSRRAKELAVEQIASVSPPGGSLLDVGCYTGTEALLLARRGFRVVGVDLSPKMIEISRSKAKRWRLSDRTRFEVARASDLPTHSGVGLAPFDTVYSVYGTLNFEPRIASFRVSAAAALRPHGAFVVGLLNPTVLYELLVGPPTLRFDGYRKLVRRGVRTRIGSGETTIHGFLYSPREFARLLRPEFALERLRGVHILYPPPRLRSRGGEGLWWVARTLDRLENRLEELPPFRSLGCFSLMVFRKST